MYIARNLFCSKLLVLKFNKKPKIFKILFRLNMKIVWQFETKSFHNDISNFSLELDVQLLVEITVCVTLKHFVLLLIIISYDIMHCFSDYFYLNFPYLCCYVLHCHSISICVYHKIKKF